jgi:hypothetical protein
MPGTPHYDWQTEMDYKIKDVPKSKDGQGYNFHVAGKRQEARGLEATIQRLKPIIEELIGNCKENGHWEGTKKRTYKRIAWEMQNMTDGLEDESQGDVIMTLKRIKMDGLKW